MPDEGSRDRRMISHLETHGSHFAARREEAGEEIGRFGDRRRPGYALQRDAHFFRDGDEPVADDLEDDGVQSLALSVLAGCAHVCTRLT